MINTSNGRTRVALITGGARGIGLASGLELGRRGNRIALADIDTVEVETAAAGLRAQGIEAKGYRLNVSDLQAIQQVVGQIDVELGGVDILLNSAGILPRINGQNPTLETMTLEIWNRTLEVNLTGPMLMAQAVVPLMKRHGWGRIVTISSRSARARTFGNMHYSASKSGLAGLHRILAQELGPFGITVNSIAPSRVNTTLNDNLNDGGATVATGVKDTPVGRIAEPEDIAAAVAYFASNEASFVTGAILDMTGGAFMP